LPRPSADLRRQHNVGAPRSERFAEHRLGLTRCVHVGGVDEVDAGVERTMHDAVDNGLIDSADRFPDPSLPAEGHRAQTELRDEDTGVGQRSIFHGF
jgi:hypothetical protein